MGLSPCHRCRLAFDCLLMSWSFVWVLYKDAADISMSAPVFVPFHWDICVWCYKMFRVCDDSCIAWRECSWQMSSSWEAGKVWMQSLPVCFAQLEVSCITSCGSEAHLLKCYDQKDLSRCVTWFGCAVLLFGVFGDHDVIAAWFIIYLGFFCISCLWGRLFFQISLLFDAIVSSCYGIPGSFCSAYVEAACEHLL